MIKIAPSILSADFVNLEKDITAVGRAGADYIHVDVMDGHFVPNITIGIPVVKSIKGITKLPLDVHLMIDNPESYAEEFAKAGADIITVHLEAMDDAGIARVLKKIRRLGKKSGLSIKPKTPAEAALKYLPLCDLLLVMTVEPGFGGQSFMADMLPKIALLRSEITRLSLNCELEVDGGINPETAGLCTAAGADVLVAGSSVFGAKNWDEQIRLIRGK